MVSIMHLNHPVTMNFKGTLSVAFCLPPFQPGIQRPAEVGPPQPCGIPFPAKLIPGKNAHTQPFHIRLSI